MGNKTKYTLADKRIPAILLMYKIEITKTLFYCKFLFAV